MDTQVNAVEPQSGKFPQAIIWIAGIALTLFCAVGIAAVMGWIPNSMGGPSDKPAMELQSASKAAPAAAKSAAKSPMARAATTRPAAAVRAAPAQVAAAANCAECGVVESVREIAAKGQGSGLGAVGGALAGNEVEKRVKTTRSYEITVRLDDGSSRVISAAGAPAWRTGDKVKLVNGVIRSNA